MIIDIVVLAIVVWSVFNGVRVGLIMSATSLLGLFVAAILASRHLNYFYTYVVQFFKVDYFPTDVSSNYYIYIASYLIFIFTFYILIYYLAYIIKSIFGILMLGWVDKVFGAVFGLLKGFIVAMGILIILNFISKFNSSLRLEMTKSEIVHAWPDISAQALQLFPEDIKENVTGYVRSANDMLR